MIGTDKIIEEVSSLPIEERVSVIDSLLQTINTPDKIIDQNG